MSFTYKILKEIINITYDITQRRWKDFGGYTLTSWINENILEILQFDLYHFSKSFERKKNIVEIIR